MITLSVLRIQMNIELYGCTLSRLQDALVLLDLIGNKGVKFRNWFAATSKLFERLQKIGKSRFSAYSGQLEMLFLYE